MTRAGLGLKHSHFSAIDNFSDGFITSTYFLPLYKYDIAKTSPREMSLLLAAYLVASLGKSNSSGKKNVVSEKLLSFSSYSNGYLCFIISGDNLLFEERMKTNLLK